MAPKKKPTLRCRLDQNRKVAWPGPKARKDDEKASEKKNKAGKRPHNSDDDETEVVKVAKVVKKKVKYESVSTRSSTRSFVMEALDKIKTDDAHADKRQALVDIGLQHLLKFTNKSLPLQMVQWILLAFDPHHRSIKMQNGERIRIEDSDVHLTLGIPMGSLEVPQGNKDYDSPALRKWKDAVCPGKVIITPSDVLKNMLSSKDMELFKRSFFLLFITAIIESTFTGAVNLAYFQQLEDLTKITSYNWCGLLINQMINSKIYCDHHPKAPFLGSVIFLMLFYVDRVEYVRKFNLPRAFPVFTTWTQDALMQHERMEMDFSGFGYECIQTAQEMPLEDIVHFTLQT